MFLSWNLIGCNIHISRVYVLKFRYFKIFSTFFFSIVLVVCQGMKISVTLQFLSFIVTMFSGLNFHIRFYDYIPSYLHFFVWYNLFQSMYIPFIIPFQIFPLNFQCIILALLLYLLLWQLFTFTLFSFHIFYTVVTHRFYQSCVWHSLFS